MTAVRRRRRSPGSSGIHRRQSRPQRAEVSAPAPHTHTLTDDQLSAIFACYRVGPRELSRRYGVTERAIKYLLQKHGVQGQRGGADPLGSQP
jgi:hypothetical protein